MEALCDRRTPVYDAQQSLKTFTFFDRSHVWPVTLISVVLGGKIQVNKTVPEVFFGVDKLPLASFIIDCL